MRFYFSILLILFFGFSSAQEVQEKDGDSNNNSLILLPKTFHSQPLIIANGVVIGSSEIKEKLVESITVIKDSTATKIFGNAGLFGVLVIITKQKFEETTTPALIAKKKSEKGDFLYALNGLIIEDSDLVISINAIRKVEVKTMKMDNGEKHKVMNIWTLTRKQRKPIKTISRGVVF